jgi:hypothetical protein
MLVTIFHHEEGDLPNLANIRVGRHTLLSFSAKMYGGSTGRTLKIVHCILCVVRESTLQSIGCTLLLEYPLNNTHMYDEPLDHW